VPPWGWPELAGRSAAGLPRTCTAEGEVEVRGVSEMADKSTFSPDEISEWFWNLLARASGSKEKLRDLLQNLSSEQLIRFEDEFAEASAQLREEPFVDHLDEGATEDTEQDVANYVVSQGKRFFEDVWRSPSHIPPYIDEGEPGILSGVADEVHYEKYGKGISFAPDHRFKSYV